MNFNNKTAKPVPTALYKRTEWSWFIMFGFIFLSAVFGLVYVLQDWDWSKIVTIVTFSLLVISVIPTLYFSTDWLIRTGNNNRKQFNGNKLSGITLPIIWVVTVIAAIIFSSVGLFDESASFYYAGMALHVINLIALLTYLIFTISIRKIKKDKWIWFLILAIASTTLLFIPNPWIFFIGLLVLVISWIPLWSIFESVQEKNK